MRPGTKRVKDWDALASDILSLIDNDIHVKDIAPLYNVSVERMRQVTGRLLLIRKLKAEGKI